MFTAMYKHTLHEHKKRKMKLEVCVLLPLNWLKDLYKGCGWQSGFAEDFRLVECSAVSLSQCNEILHMIYCLERVSKKI
jgi:hypothetical protein